MYIEIKKDAPTEKFRKHWQFSVGSPHATYALRHDWVNQLKLIRNELGIERVRFHGIFCDDMHTIHKLTDIFPIPMGNKVVEKSFRWCMTAYDNILEAGMKPFVEISFMPVHLSKKNKKGTFFYKPNISPPKNPSLWEEYIEDFINALIERYGKEEISTWYFEVWNEPDLRLPFFAGSKNDYFRLYELTVKAIKKVCPEIKVGGPSTSGSKWLREFISYCKERNIPLDFVTTHQYAGDALGGIDSSHEKTKINVDPFAAIKKKPEDTLLSVFRRLMMTDRVYSSLKRDNLIISAENSKNIAGTLPLFYTEWNLCASFSAECNDTRMTASYDLHSILGTGNVIDGSSIWCFTDLFEELHPFPQEFHGGFGMLTQSGIKKPLFHTLKYLGNMPEDRILLNSYGGNSTVAAFRDEKSLHIAATLTVTDNKKTAETIDFSIEAENEPSYVRIVRIDENHCNPYKEWQKLGAPDMPTKDQLEMISENSKPSWEELSFSYKNNTLTFSVTLNENDVCFIETA